MKTSRSLFLSGFNEDEPLLLHVVSRVAGREFLFGDEEREVFVEMMRMYEDFCEIRVLSYCVMSNHFHLLLEIPPKMEAIELSDAAFLEKLSTIYSPAYIKETKMLMQRLNKNQATKAMRELKAKFTYRIGSVSEFMKSLKQRFSRWFNKKHGRRGTLWEERYSATAVSAGSAARMTAAYIDLNPLRAGMLRSNSSAGDPRNYRWCSYAEAVAGGAKARAAYHHLFQMSEMPGAVVEELTEDESLNRYRMLMAEEGEAADTEATPMVGQRVSKTFKRRRGYSREEIEAILEKDGKLSRAEILRCKTRYFSDGAVIGSKAFVDSFFKKIKGNLPGDRQIGASPIRKLRSGSKIAGKVENGRLYSFRNLQKDVYG